MIDFKEFKEFFSEYDESITGDSQRDPLGLQVIWSYFGQQIFGNQITSISNDIRNFTIDLFHHYIIRSLVEDNDLVIENTHYKETFQTKDTPVFKTAFIIFLENLLTYSVHYMKTEKRDKFDGSGLLGSYSAITKWNLQDANPLIIAHPESGILARQISLGINGRYKTPLVQCNIFDYNYTYRLQGNTATWDRINRIFSDWKDADKLKRKLVSIVINTLSGAYISSKKDNQNIYLDKTRKAYRETRITRMDDLKAYPFIEFLSCKEKYPDHFDLYTSGYGNMERLQSHFTELWKELLGINQGEANSLYDVIQTGNETAKQIAEKAYSIEKHEKEKKKLFEILTIEPFLVFINFLFQIVNARETRNLDDVAAELQKLKFYDAVGAFKWEEIGRIIEEPENSVTKERLSKLTKIPLNEKDLANSVSRLIEYHKEIMDYRGLFPWFSLAEDGNIHHVARMYNLAALDKQKPTDWIHDYYIYSLKSLRAGLETKV